VGRIGFYVAGAILYMFSGFSYLILRKQPCEAERCRGYSGVGDLYHLPRSCLPGSVHTSSPYVYRYIRELVPTFPVNLVFPLGIFSSEICQSLHYSSPLRMGKALHH
jgi:hypothetical protein